MSKELIKKALNLFQDDLETNDTSKKKKKGKMQSISTNKKGVKKQRQRLKQQRQRQQLSLQSQKFKQFPARKHREETDNTDDNIQCLLRFSNNKSSEVMTKILDHHKGRLAKNRPEKPVKEEPKSIFCDTDFDKFEEEYNFEDF